MAPRLGIEVRPFNAPSPITSSAAIIGRGTVSTSAFRRLGRGGSWTEGGPTHWGHIRGEANS